MIIKKKSVLRMIPCTYLLTEQSSIKWKIRNDKERKDHFQVEDHSILMFLDRTIKNKNGRRKISRNIKKKNNDALVQVDIYFKPHSLRHPHQYEFVFNSQSLFNEYNHPTIFCKFILHFLIRQ